METISLESERYWLAHSEGFRVDAPGGRVGFVEAVVEREPGRAHAFVVRAGILGRRLLVVAADEVEEIAPRRKRLRLRRFPEVGGAEFLVELLRRLPSDEVSARPSST
jgi:hypothetical protein